MKTVEQVSRRAACVSLKRSLSTSCGLLLKQLIRVKVSFKCLLPGLSDDLITL